MSSSPADDRREGERRKDGSAHGGPDLDTIAAPATPPGVGAVALIRVSGPGASRILARLSSGGEPVPESRLAAPEPRRATLRTIFEPDTGERIDRALVTWFPGPDSYTGEDMVEIAGHGGVLSTRLLLEACLAAGAREAEPGEYTRRAYLNGKLDLVQAEAVADLVEGRSRALRRASLVQLDRGLSSRIAELREELVGLEVLLTHHVDFPEEDEAPVPLGRVVEQARAVAGGLRRLLDTAPEGELLREGAVTVLAGLPNSGKSSLFNALLGRERAIVTDVPGTTRDALEAVASVGGFPFRLVDTAGLRESEDRVERIGIEVARKYLAGADLVLFCAEATRPLVPEEAEFLSGLADVPCVLVRTMADRKDDGGAEDGDGGSTVADGDDSRAVRDDLPAVHEESRAVEVETWMDVVETSSRTGRGLDELRKLLPELVYRGLVTVGSDAPVVTRARQARGIEAAVREVESFAGALEEGVPPEVAATHLRSAESALEEILGIVTVDDILDRVFRDFCIGK